MSNKKLLLIMGGDDGPYPILSKNTSRKETLEMAYTLSCEAVTIQNMHDFKLRRRLGYKAKHMQQEYVYTPSLLLLTIRTQPYWMHP